MNMMYYYLKVTKNRFLSCDQLLYCLVSRLLVYFSLFHLTINTMPLLPWGMYKCLLVASRKAHINFQVNMLVCAIRLVLSYVHLLDVSQ